MTPASEVFPKTRVFGNTSDAGVAELSRGSVMYAILFELNVESLRENYGDPCNNAYIEIRRVLQRHGFNWQQGSVYFGGDSINAVICVLAAIDLARELPWFSASVCDIWMLRVEELNDLMPAIQQAGNP